MKLAPNDKAGVLVHRFIVLMMSLALAATSALVGERYGAPPADIASFLKRLAEAYPEAIADFDGVELRLRSGDRLRISDGHTDKSFEELLDQPDIDDMFAFAYPAGAAPAQPPDNFDPGRVRVEALFRAIYGDCRATHIQKAMRDIEWLPRHGGGTVRFTKAAGADRALEAVSRDLDKLPDAMIKFLKPTAGTFNCRPIAGTERMSMHAYGGAIDVNTKYSAYWRWAKARKDGRLVWSNKYPKQIVDIFERHGFIWGGRWYHFDTMHFEYRPELLPR